MRRWFFALVLILIPMRETPLRTPLCPGFFPPHNAQISARQIHATGIGEKDFDSVLDRLEKLYSPEIAGRGGRLVIERDWSDGMVNAFASQESGDWIITMAGGLARHPAITSDGFALVACHELGHHLGGAPKYLNGMVRDWASYEGQSDYYAPLKCLRRYFAGDDNGKILAAMTVDPVAVADCERDHAALSDQQVCVRSAMAGLSMAGVMADLEQLPLARFDAPDPTQVTETDMGHPAGQCRLDTYLSGALCRQDVSEALSDVDYHPGACTDSIADATGVRPRCWFAP